MFGNFEQTVNVYSFGSMKLLILIRNKRLYGVSLRIQSECGKIRTRITPNMDTFRPVAISRLSGDIEENLGPKRNTLQAFYYFIILLLFFSP